MRTSHRVRHCDITYPIHRERIVEATVVAQDAAVAVGRVLAEADVGADEQLREPLANKPDAVDHRALRVVGGGPQCVLGPWLEGDAKEDDGAQSLGDEGGEKASELVDAPSVRGVGQLNQAKVMSGHLF